MADGQLSKHVLIAAATVRSASETELRRDNLVSTRSRGAVRRAARRRQPTPTCPTCTRSWSSGVLPAPLRTAPDNRVRAAGDMAEGPRTSVRKFPALVERPFGFARILVGPVRKLASRREKRLSIMDLASMARQHRSGWPRGRSSSPRRRARLRCTSASAPSASNGRGSSARRAHRNFFFAKDGVCGFVGGRDPLRGIPEASLGTFLLGCGSLKQCTLRMSLDRQGLPHPVATAVLCSWVR